MLTKWHWITHIKQNRPKVMPADKWIFNIFYPAIRVLLENRTFPSLLGRSFFHVALAVDKKNQLEDLAPTSNLKNIKHNDVCSIFFFFLPAPIKFYGYCNQCKYGTTAKTDHTAFSHGEKLSRLNDKTIEQTGLL